MPERRCIWVSEQEFQDWSYAVDVANLDVIEKACDPLLQRYRDAPVNPEETVLLALLNAEHRSPGMGQEPEPLHDLYQPEGAAIVRKNAVLRALGWEATPRGYGITGDFDRKVKP